MNLRKEMCNRTSSLLPQTKWDRFELFSNGAAFL